MAYCPNCGREGLNFCSICGTALFSKKQDIIKEDIIQKPKIFLIVLSLLSFVAGLIIFAIFCDKPISKIYLKYTGISALIYIAVVFVLAFIPF
mgnify:CR=1 FL=1